MFVELTGANLILYCFISICELCLNENIKSKEVLCIFRRPQTLSKVFGKYTAPSFQYTILTMAKIKYLTSFYKVMFVLMIIMIS